MKNSSTTINTRFMTKFFVLVVTLDVLLSSSSVCRIDNSDNHDAISFFTFTTAFSTVRTTSHHQSTNNTTTTTQLYQSTRNAKEDLYAAVHRKEYEMKAVNQQHTSTTDPIRMAMSYAQESASPMRLAKALRRVHDDPFREKEDSEQDESTKQRKEKLQEHGLQEMSMRRASFIVDIKRKSLSQPAGEKPFCRYDNAGMVAEAMVRLGADVVMVNVDYHSYGGDMSELKTAVNAVRKVSNTSAVVMKDIVVDEIQLGLAKEAGADGILLIASVLGPALENFLDLATTIGLETIVECHTRNEIDSALSAMATNILVSNYDRIAQEYLSTTGN